MQFIALYVCRYIFLVRTENVLLIAGYVDIYRIPSHSLQCRSSVSHATKGESTIHDVSENYDHLIINVTRLATANFPHIYCDHHTKLGYCFFHTVCAHGEVPKILGSLGLLGLGCS